MFRASIASILTPTVLLVITALAFGGAPGEGLMPVAIIFSLVISAAHFLLLGLPVLLVLKRFSYLTFPLVVAIGFLSASIPSAIKLWPLPDGDFVGFTEAELFGMTIKKTINGIPTLWGWVIYLKNVFFVGAAFGLPSALSFWYFYPGDPGPLVDESGVT